MLEAGRGGGERRNFFVERERAIREGKSGGEDCAFRNHHRFPRLLLPSYLKWRESGEGPGSPCAHWPFESPTLVCIVLFQVSLGRDREEGKLARDC